VADALRNHIKTAEYKHVVLGLIFKISPMPLRGRSMGWTRLEAFVALDPVIRIDMEG
jgi:hypothetical protein